jgi:hypothetical protein
VASVLQGDVPGAVAALRAFGATTTADVMGMTRGEIERVAKDHGLDTRTLLGLQGLSESLTTKPTLAEGVSHYAAGGAPG